MNEPYQAVRRYRRNTKGRDFVVGDLHGCFSQLDRQLDVLEYDCVRDRLFSVGDLVNRGPESAAVLDAVSQHKIKAICGNHEDMLVRWYFGDALDSETVLQNGGEWFMDIADGSGRALPIARYMAALPYAIEIETTFGLVGLLHADAPRGNWEELTAVLEREDRQGITRRRVLWQRTRWKTSTEDGSFPVPTALSSLFGITVARRDVTRSDPHQWIEGVAAVIVGHTPVSAPTVRGNVINIDTGAVFGGNLTILDLTDVPYFLPSPEGGTAI